MHFDDYTHVVMDRDSGDPLAVVGYVDELEDGRRFGLVRWFTGTMNPTYLWLGGLHLLPLADAAANIRAQVEAALGTAALP